MLIPIAANTFRVINTAKGAILWDFVRTSRHLPQYFLRVEFFGAVHLLSFPNSPQFFFNSVTPLSCLVISRYIGVAPVGSTILVTLISDFELVITTTAHVVQPAMLLLRPLVARASPPPDIDMKAERKKDRQPKPGRPSRAVKTANQKQNVLCANNQDAFREIVKTGFYSARPWMRLPVEFAQGQRSRSAHSASAIKQHVRL
jgi:hypothetical protein